jgi:hypothetical protein
MCLLTNGRRIHNREVRGASENGLSSTRRRALDKLLYALGALSFARLTTIFSVYSEFLTRITEFAGCCTRRHRAYACAHEMVLNVPIYRAGVGLKLTPASRL